MTSGKTPGVYPKLPIGVLQCAFADNQLYNVLHIIFTCLIMVSNTYLIPGSINIQVVYYQNTPGRDYHSEQEAL